MSDQFFNAVLLLHGPQQPLALLHLLLQAPQTLQQLLVGDGQGLVAPDDGHDQGVRAVIKVS